MKIICLTQRPIQTLILIYLLGSKNIFFDHIFYCNLKKKNLLGFRDEGSSSWSALKHQCELLKIPFTKISNIKDTSFIAKLKKIKADSMISLLVDTIFNKNIISIFKKGIYSSHGGMLPFYRGNDCDKWALINNERYAGISLQKINVGIDTGKIIKVSKLNVRDFTNLDEIDQKLYYQFKLYDFVDLIQKLKQNKKIKFLKKNQKGKQYFEMHKTLVNIVKKRFK
jgi:methionyl-tRNA formyltransferase